MSEEKESDFSKHVLIPTHKIMKEEAVNKLLEKYNISLLQLPSILKSDPMIKLLNAKVNDVIEIIRAGSTGKYKYYRRVTE